jgi:hypothetical protein
MSICTVQHTDVLLFGIGYCVINWLCILQHAASSTADVDRKNVLNVDMEGVVCDVEQCAVGTFMVVMCMAWKGGRDVHWI